MPLVCVLVAGSIHGKWQPIPVFLPGESHGQRMPGGLQSTESQSRTRPKRLSKHACPCRKAVKVRWPWGAERRWKKAPETSLMLLPPSVQERKDPALRQYLYLVFLQPRDKGRGWRTRPGGRGLRERTGSRGPSLQQPEAERRGGVSGGSGTRASGDARRTDRHVTRKWLRTGRGRKK